MSNSSDNTVKIMVLAVLLALVLVGGALAIVIVNNNMQCESQAAQQAAEQQRKDEETEKERNKNDANTALRGICLGEADKDYWEYVKLNAMSTRETDDGPVYTASQQVWDTAAENKKTATDECYRQYPNS